jgi:hypothetical protein
MLVVSYLEIAGKVESAGREKQKQSESERKK